MWLNRSFRNLAAVALAALIASLPDTVAAEGEHTGISGGLNLESQVTFDWGGGVAPYNVAVRVDNKQVVLVKGVKNTRLDWRVQGTVGDSVLLIVVDSDGTSFPPTTGTVSSPARRPSQKHSRLYLERQWRL